MKDKTNSPAELLDLVDENDQIIGEVLRKEANQNPALLHRETYVLIYDEEKRVLLQQRSSKKKIHPGHWTISCAGHVPKGMKPIDVAHIELKEELSFDTELKFIDKILVSHPHETHFAYCYIGKYPGGIIYPNKKEVKQIRFFFSEEFNNLIKFENVPKTTQKMVKRFFAGEFDEHRLSSVSGV